MSAVDSPISSTPDTPGDVQRWLRDHGYVADVPLATVALLGLKLDKPLLVEGPAGTGKTAFALAWAAALGRRFIRLQCYDGLDETRALYEWSYGKQLLSTQLIRESLSSRGEVDLPARLAELTESGAIDAFFSEAFLIARPLLQAIRSPEPALLLIDEIDRAGEDLEALLLEMLSEYQVTVPELGPIRAVHIPVVVLTSNATRDLSDALKRRCLHVSLDYPSRDLEREILDVAIPGIDDALAAAIIGGVTIARSLDLRKRPSVGETIDWARALRVLGATRIDADIVNATAGVIAKYAEDEILVRDALAG